VLREMDVRHPCALLVQELVEGHQRAYGTGCTTLLAWIGLFATAVAQLRQEDKHMQPSLLAHTLADIRDRCSALLRNSPAATAVDGMDASAHPRLSRRGLVLPLTCFIDEYVASQPTSLVASTAVATAKSATPTVDSAPIVNVTVANEADDAAWFFEDEPAPSAPSFQQLPSEPFVPASYQNHPSVALQDASLHGFLSRLASRLCMGQESSAPAAVAVVQRMLRTDGLADLAALRRALDSSSSASADDGAQSSSIDITERWDLAGSLKLQSQLGAAPHVPTDDEHKQQPDVSSRYHRWELVDGLLLDLFPTELPSVRAALAQMRRKQTAAAILTRGLEDAGGVSVGVVLVLGDVLVPSSSDAIALKPPPSASSSVSAAAAAMQQVLQRGEQRLEAFLARLLRRLQSLQVGLVLAKGSISKPVLSHLRSAGIVCLECVNLAQLDAVSRLAVAPAVALLDEVGAAHVGRARVKLQHVGWDAELVHRNVVRQMERENDSAARHSSVHKLLVSPEEDDGGLQAGDATLHLTLLSSHSTALHAHVWSTSFWNCLCRLRQALRDGAVLRGAGAVERTWIRAIDGRADAIQAELARRIQPFSPSRPSVGQSHLNADPDELAALTQQLSVHRAIAGAFRTYLHLLLTNADVGTAEQRWVDAQGQADANQTQSIQRDDGGWSADDESNISASSVSYDCRGSKLSALHLSVYLFQLLSHVDATLLCAHGRTMYQSMDGRHARLTSSINFL
jgi:hypothetical protein